jgi:hypothetical protein
MHIVVASLLVALVGCVLLLAAFGGFVHLLERGERRREPSPRT